MRSLARGLNVLDFVARSDGVTFTQIVQATGLAKPVIARVLTELVRSGFVYRNQSDRRYFGAPIIAAAPGGTYAQLVTSAAAEPLSWLVEQVKWPSDLFVLDGPEMLMVDSNRPASPYSLRWSRIGRRAPILLSSVGRAVLAEMSAESREGIYDEIKARGLWSWQTSWMRQPLDAIIAEVQRQGFAMREKGFAGPALERSGESSIGVALSARGVIVGGVNIWWPDSADQNCSLVQRLVKPLKTCRAMIESNLAQISGPRGKPGPAGTEEVPTRS